MFSKIIMVMALHLSITFAAAFVLMMLRIAVAFLAKSGDDDDHNDGIYRLAVGISLIISIIIGVDLGLNAVSWVVLAVLLLVETKLLIELGDRSHNE